MLKCFLSWVFRPRTCRMCDQPRQSGIAFCSAECHTEWRVQNAVMRGIALGE